jgi:DNA-binding NarL/FixJ family response regulator
VAPIQLMLVDDQDLIRESLHIVLDMDPDIEVVALAENGKAALEKCEALKPNLVLMDIHMPEMNGVEATSAIKQRYPETKVVILTTFQEIDYVTDALSAGAEGYLLKAIHPKDLISGLKWVHQGGTLIPQDIASMLVTQIKSDAGRLNKANAGVESAAASSSGTQSTGSNETYGLSERELQVLHCISDGLNNREIAGKLFLSEGTVKNYISSIYAKLDVRDRIQASNKAHDKGIL